MLWIAGLSMLCLGLCLPMFLYNKSCMRYSLAASFKTLGTLCALIPALVAAIRLDPRCYVCVAALALHAAADYALEFSQYAGSGLFMAGHVCYIAFLTLLFPVSAVQLICVLLLIAFTGFTFWRWRTAIGKQMPLFLVYGLVLCLMCSSAVGGITAHTLQGLLMALAGALFFLSDGMISFRLLYPTRPFLNWLIMIFYYIAQLLFGFSCLLI